jgi:hypothetical protein
LGDRFDFHRQIIDTPRSVHADEHHFDWLQRCRRLNRRCGVADAQVDETCRNHGEDDSGIAVDGQGWRLSHWHANRRKPHDAGSHIPFACEIAGMRSFDVTPISDTLDLSA